MKTILTLILLYSHLGQANTDVSLFAPKNPCPPLLILSRSTNRNRIWYSENGALWEMREKAGTPWEQLLSIEKHIYEMVENENHLVSIKSTPNIQFTKTATEEGCKVLINTKEKMIMREIHIEISGSGIFSKLKAATLFGVSTENQAPVSKVITF